jgi:FtsP/CotA-like multicopper oxidase with cupredoxin domain
MERGQMRYCYVDAGRRRSAAAAFEARRPPDYLNLKNELTLPGTSSVRNGGWFHGRSHAHRCRDACAGGEMTSLSTNLHFHGLTIPPVCHQDDVLRTLHPAARSSPLSTASESPADEAPGLYWYHPHVHGFTSPRCWEGLPEL